VPLGIANHQVVYDVGEGPNYGYASEGDAEQDDVQQADAQEVGESDVPAVHHPRVGGSPRCEPCPHL
jgi:hypothetical protein